METISSKDARYEEFSEIYRKISSTVKSALFDILWEEESLTHQQILGMATDTHTHLLQFKN